MAATIFTPSDEHAEFRASVRRFHEDKVTRDHVRRLLDAEGGHDPEVWGQLSGQLGLVGLHVPEEHGGSGFGFTELAIVFEEMGRALTPGPYLATVGLAANAIMTTATSEQQHELLGPIAAGGRIATLAESEALEGPGALGVEARGDGATARLTGTCRFVLAGDEADLVVVPAHDEGGRVGLFAMAGDSDGLTRTPLAGIDPTRRHADLALDEVPAARLGHAEDAWAALTIALDQATVCLAAEMLGGAQACLEMAVAYSKDRYQFGRPIGSFQAVKHRCADMLVAVESTRSAVAYAAHLAAEADPELATVAPLTKAFASEAYVTCATDNIFVHGGVGFTWEHDAHLYLRRATASQALLGTPARHRARVADAIGL